MWGTVFSGFVSLLLVLGRLFSFWCARALSLNNYTVDQKKRATLLLSISSPIIDRFSKFFYVHTLQTICISAIIIYLTTR